MSRVHKMLLIVIAILILSASQLFAFENFHGHKGRPHPKLDSLFEAAVSLDKSTEGMALVDACIEKYGGLEKLKTVKSIRQSWRMEIAGTRDTVDIVKTWAPNKRLLIKTYYDGNMERKILRGDSAWFESHDTVSFVEGNRYKGFLFSYLTLGMPVSIKTETFAEMKYGVREGDSLGYIYMLKTDSLMIVIGIDPADNLIKSSEGVIFQGKQKSIYQNIFDGHKLVNGYWTPNYQQDISLWMTMGRSKMVNCEYNKEVADNFFTVESDKLSY